MPKNWYVLKVKPDREEGIARSIDWEATRQGFAEQFGRIVAFHKYPGYLLINMDLTDETLRLVRETQGVEDFTGAAGQPVPLKTKEVVRMVGGEG